MMTEENVREYIGALNAILMRGDTVQVDGETVHFTTQEQLWCVLQPEDRQRYFEMLGEMERAHLIHWDRTGYIEVTRDGEGLMEIASQSRTGNPGLGSVVVSSAVSGATMQAVSHFLGRLMNSGRQENPVSKSRNIGQEIRTYRVEVPAGKNPGSLFNAVTNAVGEITGDLEVIDEGDEYVVFETPIPTGEFKDWVIMDPGGGRYSDDRVQRWPNLSWRKRRLTAADKKAGYDAVWVVDRKQKRSRAANPEPDTKKLKARLMR